MTISNALVFADIQLICLNPSWHSTNTILRSKHCNLA